MLDNGYGFETVAKINEFMHFTTPAAKEREVKTPIDVVRVRQFNPLNKAADFSKLFASLNENMTKVLDGIEAANPQLIIKEYNWWERLWNEDSVASAKYAVGVKNIKFYTVAMEKDRTALKESTSSVRLILQGVLDCFPKIELLIKNGLEFIKEQQLNPNPEHAHKIQRFAKQVESLNSFQTLTGVNIKQLEVDIQNAEMAIDRSNDIEKLLVPMWNAYGLTVSESAEYVRKHADEVAEKHKRLSESLYSLKPQSCGTSTN